MIVYFVTRDNYFSIGFLSYCEMCDVNAARLPVNILHLLPESFFLDSHDTLVLTLDVFKGRFLDFVKFSSALRKMNIKTIVVGDIPFHLKLNVDYFLCKKDSFYEYITAFFSEKNRFANRFTPLSSRDLFVLKNFYFGVNHKQLAILMGGVSNKVISMYKLLALKKLGLRNINQLFKVF